MKLKPKVFPKDHIFKAVDSHTMGKPTRIIYEDFPKLTGSSYITGFNQWLLGWTRMTLSDTVF